MTDSGTRHVDRAAPSLSRAGARRALRRDTDDHPGRHDRDSRAAVHPARPGLRPGRPDLGAERLPDRLRRPAAAGRAARRPDRPPRVFLAGLAVFTLASLACGLAGSPELLIAARFVQGAGAALVSAVSLGMITGLYAEPRRARRGRSPPTASSARPGPRSAWSLGGVLTQAASWHWIFFVNLPIGVAAALAGRRVLPAEPGAGLRAGADALGAVLVTGGLMARRLRAGRHGAARLAVGAHAGLRRRRGAAARRLRAAPGPGGAAAAAAADHPVLAQRQRRQPGAGAGDRRRVRLPGADCALHAARAGLLARRRRAWDCCPRRS